MTDKKKSKVRIEIEGENYKIIFKDGQVVNLEGEKEKKAKTT